MPSKKSNAYKLCSVKTEHFLWYDGAVKGEPMTKLDEKMIPIQDKINYGIGNLSVGIAMQVVGTYWSFFLRLSWEFQVTWWA